MLTILTVDDAAPIRLLLRSLLGELPDVRVRQSDGGTSAINRLQEEIIDIVITDWNMPDMSGIELVRRIRGLESRVRFVPIIMLTGHAHWENVAVARDAGVDEFLVKPISAASLFLRLDAVVHHRRDFIVTDNFFGPDRRRKTEQFNGPDRRLLNSDTEFLD